MATLTPEDVQFQIAHWDDDKGPLVTTITTIFMVFAMIAVVLRLVTRKVIIKISWQVDDYAIIVAMVRAFRESGGRVVNAPTDFRRGILRWSSSQCLFQNEVFGSH